MSTMSDIERMTEFDELPPLMTAGDMIKVLGLNRMLPDYADGVHAIDFSGSQRLFPRESVSAIRELQAEPSTEGPMDAIRKYGSSANGAAAVIESEQNFAAALTNALTDVSFEDNSDPETSSTLGRPMTSNIRGFHTWHRPPGMPTAPEITIPVDPPKASLLYPAEARDILGLSVDQLLDATPDLLHMRLAGPHNPKRAEHRYPAPYVQHVAGFVALYAQMEHPGDETEGPYSLFAGTSTAGRDIAAERQRINTELKQVTDDDGYIPLKDLSGIVRVNYPNLFNRNATSKGGDIPTELRSFRTKQGALRQALHIKADVVEGTVFSWNLPGGIVETKSTHQT